MALPVFPTLPGLAYPVKWTPIWSTIHQVSASGKDSPLGVWSYPKRRYELSFEFLRSIAATPEMQTLVGFFHSVRGSALAWQFTDEDDGAVTAQAFGSGTGAQTAFQLVRSFGSFVEPVFAPSGTPIITVAGVTKTAGVDYTIGTTGLVTFATAPANGAALAWTGSFNWLCRFDNDTLDVTKFMDKHWSADSVTFTTVKI